MQYGADLFPYQRVSNIKKDEQKKELDRYIIIKMVAYCIVAFLISRVMLINSMAPFGIAFLVAVMMQKERKIPLVAGIGALAGYASLYATDIRNLGAYIFLVATITSLNYFVDKLTKYKKLALVFSIIFIEFLIMGAVISKLGLAVALFTAFFETACIFPIYFIMNYSIICFKNLKTKHLFSNEEIISMAIMVSLIISGCWGANIYSVSIRNILALTFVLAISYTKGSTVGATTGIAMGVIVGITSKDMVLFISIYGLCGLITGIFRESGKWLTALAYIISFSIIKIYSSTGNEFKIIEAAICCVIFLSIPNKFYNILALELDWERKLEDINDNYVDKVKSMLVGRLNNFTEVLDNISEILNSLVDNDKLSAKNKSAALIENVADRVCSNCNMNSMCWRREIYYTYAAFGELIQNYEEKRNEVPDEIERKCVKRTALINTTEDIVNDYIIDEMWKSRMGEGRELLASQIKNMSCSVQEIIGEFNESITFNSEAENNVRRILDKNSVKYTDIMCYNDKNHRIVLKLSMHACGGKQICVKQVLPLINEVLSKNMCVSDEGCNINPEDKSCNVTFEETPKFHVASYVERACKDGEKYNGDSYSFGKLNDGTYMSVISDGMGSGPQAGQESNAAVELIDKFTKAGFSKLIAINTVNSIMTLKFSENEKFSTVDLCNIDLYTGKVDFLKVGAVASFIKSGDKVEVIKSKSLPIGVLDKADIDTINRQAKNGDVIIMVSDGILDYNNENVGKVDWILDYLEKSTCTNPKELAEQIIKKAKQLGGNKAKDDMTVLVSKIYSLY